MDRRHEKELARLIKKGYHEKKHDKGKVRYDLLPWHELELLAKVLTVGAEKYGDNTWQTVPDGLDRYKAAMLRHYAAYCMGEEYDQETGLPHMAHVVCNAVFILRLSHE
jgi:hypothetical protein